MILLTKITDTFLQLNIRRAVKKKNKKQFEGVCLGLLGLIERFPHQDVFSNSPVEYPGLLGNVGKCPVGCEGALQEVHLE